MHRLAMLIGVDDYPFRPLTSCLNDARAMRDALVRQGVFSTEETVLLTAPQMAGTDGPATRNEILGRIRSLYAGETAPPDRFLFYFAGHGISHRTGAGAGALNAVLLCHGVRDVEDDGGEMIDLDELLERFRMRGPAEQFWVVDACRDIPEAKRGPPVVGQITWAREGEESPRARSVLYAVAPLGRATAVAGASGLLTERLVEGLAGRGCAAFWDETEQSYLVSLRSACDYARAQLAPALSAGWQRDFLLPRIERESQPPPRPLRKLPETEWPADRPVLLAVEPAAAVGVIEATLTRQRQVQAHWPPLGPSPPLTPDLYSFRAAIAKNAPGWDRVEPTRGTIDTRETGEIRLTAYPAAPGHPAGIEGAPRSVPALVRFEPPRDPPILPAGLGPDAWVRVDVVDPGARVTIAPPARGAAPRLVANNMWERVETGVWRVEARLGGEVLGIAEEDLAAGEHAQFGVVARVTSAIGEIDWLPEARMTAQPDEPIPPGALHGAALPSETMGWLQGALLPTLLPLLAFRPFDTHRRVLPNLQTPDLRYFESERVDTEPVSVALASDVGDETRADLHRIILDGTSSRDFQQVWSHPAGVAVYADPGLLAAGDIDTARDPLFADNFFTLDVPGREPLKVAFPLYEGRVACGGIALRPEGIYEISLVSLRAIDVEEYFVAPVARSIAVVAQLLASGQPPPDALPALRDVSFGKWLDPVLGALAWHGYALFPHEGGVPASMATIARNMLAFFPGLLDSLIIAGGEDPARLWLGLDAHIDAELLQFHTALRSALLDPRDLHSVTELAERLDAAGYSDCVTAIRSAAARNGVPVDRFPAGTARQAAKAVLGRVPVLSASVDLLADLALRAEVRDHWALDLRRRLDPRGVWNAIRIGEE